MAADGQVSYHEAVDVIGQLDTFVQMFCYFPKSRQTRSAGVSIHDHIASGYAISISNNGETFSDEDSITIFDSTCVNCSDNGQNVSCWKQVGWQVISPFQV